jgi:His/Glu/Gln/Arg/opine family amino acid ABC transporter permease subunit
MIDVALIISSLPILLHGALVSLQVAGLALVLGFLGGTILGSIESTKNKPLKLLARIYVTLVRGTPMLIQIVFLFYVFSITGLALSAFASAVIAIGANSAAYVSEVVRSGIISVGSGQIEAARTLGISWRKTMTSIVIPQALRAVLPALGNEGVTLIKDSSLASLIGVTELYKEGQIIISTTYDALSIYCAIALIYLCLTTSLSYAVMAFESHLNRKYTSC